MQSNRFKSLVEGKPDPDGFQKAIIELVYEVLESEKGRFRRSTLASFYHLTGLDYHILNRCKNRDFVFDPYKQFLRHKKGNLSPAFFEEFLKRVLEYVSISMTDLMRLAFAGGKAYVDQLYNAKWFKEKYFSKLEIKNFPKPQDLDYPPHQTQIDLPEISNQVADILSEAQSINCPIVLLGGVGTGKTAIIDQIKSIGEKDNYLVFPAYVKEGNYRRGLQGWYEAITHLSPAYIVPDEVIATTVKEHAEDQPIMFLIDGVSDIEVFRSFATLFDCQNHVIVVTTDSLLVADSLISNPKYCIRMNGFSDDNAILYYTKNWNGKKEDVETISKLNHLFQGNPASLHFAFQLVQRVGWKNALGALSEPTTSVVIEQIKGAYKPLVKFYDNLSQFDKHLFRAIANLSDRDSYGVNLLADLWGVSKSNAAVIATHFEMGPFIRIVSDKNEIEWAIPKYARAFAYYQLDLDRQKNNILQP